MVNRENSISQNSLQHLPPPQYGVGHVDLLTACSLFVYIPGVEEGLAAGVDWLVSAEEGSTEGESEREERKGQEWM